MASKQTNAEPSDLNLKSTTGKKDKNLYTIVKKRIKKKDPISEDCYGDLIMYMLGQSEGDLGEPPKSNL